jgi:dihydroxyacetone kinase-like protein
MSLLSISLEETIEMLLHVSRGIVKSKDVLSQADQAIGDGDHGIGMARGFEAVETKIRGGTFSGFDDLFKSIGMTLLSSIGGAAGAVFGSFFLGAADGLAGITKLDGAALSSALSSGLEMVKKRGGGQVGDKTMIDALEPAVIVAQEIMDKPLDEIISKAVVASQEGMENTKNMIATTGKAKTLGARSLGYPDPGAISMSLIFQFADEYISNLAETGTKNED